MGFEPTMAGLQPTALVHLATASGTSRRNRTYSFSFGDWSVAMTWDAWLHRKDSNLRDLLQRQADYHYLTVHGCGTWIRTTVNSFKDCNPTAR